jgi:hypothetical protein
MKNKIKKILESKTFLAVICTIGVLALLFFVFQAGRQAGFRKASFGRDWGRNYEMNFGSPRQGPKMMGEGFGDFGKLPNAHGAIGKIIKIELPTLIVLDEKDKTEKVVLTDTTTQVHRMRDAIKIEDLKIDDNIIVIGEPNSLGQIEAKFIRFFPVPFQTPIKPN